ncbi:MAG: hypothetical protein S4CHLAM6_07980 [Chlamydiae bacterium]|nr:hypothetical protein [Chlamydiota bacterium]
MSIKASQLFSNFNNQNAGVNRYRNELSKANETLDFARNAKNEIEQAMHSQSVFNWENDPRREILEKLYSLEEFQGLDKSYSFTNPQVALPLIQRLEQYHSDCIHQLELKKNIFAEKKSALQQSHNELINIINDLGRVMSVLTR